VSGPAAAFPLDAAGVWRVLHRPRRDPPVPALFLDRDGTLVELVPYLSDPAAVRLIGAAVTLIRAANQRGLPVVVISNQSGIARGLFDWHAFAAVERRIEALLALEGATLDAVFACPAAPDSNAPCRKPNPGMLLAASEALGLDLAASWIAGDSAIDLEAGRRAGLRRAWLAPTGHGARDAAAARALAEPDFALTLLRPLDELARLVGAPQPGSA
jgi:D-glycero-D-manno-heptose 1,7-bisphosphate phosphatase